MGVPKSLLLLALPSCTFASNGLVAPGAIGEYRGASRDSGPRGWGYVSQYPVGFFVAGSSLHDMNGLYRRSASSTGAGKLGLCHFTFLPHACHLSYVNRRTGCAAESTSMPHCTCRMLQLVLDPVAS